MQFYHKCEKTVTGTLCSGIVVHYGQNTQGVHTTFGDLQEIESDQHVHSHI